MNINEVFEYTNIPSVHMLTRYTPLPISLLGEGSKTKTVHILSYELLTKVPMHQMFSQLRLPFNLICLTEDEIDNFIDNYPSYLSQGDFGNYFLLPIEEHYWSVMNIDFQGIGKVTKRIFIIGEDQSRPKELKLRMFIRQPL